MHADDATVLVVEDEQQVRSLVKRVLERDGYRVLTADSARHAIDIAGESDTPIDLLIADVVMPGMSGAELAQALAADRGDLAILLMSGYPRGAAGPVAIAADTPLLEKPFTAPDLLAGVRGALDRGAAD